MTLEKKRSFLINTAFIVTILCLAFILIKYVIGYIMPFIIGTFMAVVLHKPIEFICKRTRIPRAIVSVVLVISVIAGIFTLLVLLCSRLYNEAAGLVSVLPDYIPSLSDAFGRVSDTFSILLQNLPEAVRETVRELPTKLATGAVSYLSSTLPGIAAAIATAVPGVLIGFIITVVSACFITIDYTKIGTLLNRILARYSNINISSIKTFFVDKLFRMLRGYIILMFITFCELAIALSILGVKYSVVLALCIAIIDILPILGTGTILIPWGIISLFSGNLLWGIGLLVTYGIITVLRNVLEPKIIGSQIGLPPLVMLISLYLGLKIFGFLGMICVPLGVIIFINIYRSRNSTDGQQTDKEDCAQ